MAWEPLGIASSHSAGASRSAGWALPDLRLPPPVAAAPEAPREQAVSAPVGPSAEEVAYAAGVADGARQVRDELGQRTAVALQALAGAARALDAMHTAFAGEMEESLHALAVAVAQQILQREIAADPAIVRDLVRRAIDLLPVEGSIEARLHPEDLAALSGQLDLYAASGRTLDVQWVADPTVERGGYLLETPQRVVDGQIEPGLRALYDRLRHG